MGFHEWFAEADFSAQFQTAQKACHPAGDRPQDQQANRPDRPDHEG
jgi:hypothetical protein